MYMYTCIDTYIHTHIHTQDTVADDEAFQIQIENDARVMAASMQKAMIMLQRAARGFLIRKCVFVCMYVCTYVYSIASLCCTELPGGFLVRKCVCSFVY
jgi:hypothetical protein